MRGLLDNRRGALFGAAGPLLFLVGVVLVSWSARDFMAELGWEVWPSGTALGPHGWATVLVFLLTGLCQMVFARTLLAQAGESTVLGAFLLPDGLKVSNYLFFAILLTPLLILAIRVLATGGWSSIARHADSSPT